MKIVDCTDPKRLTVMPETAIVRKGYPFFVPVHDGRWKLGLETGVKIDRLGKTIERRFAHRYYRERVIILKAVLSGREEPIAEGFDGSLMISDGMDRIERLKIVVESLPDVKVKQEVLKERSERFYVVEEVFGEAIERASRYYTLHTGDIVIVAKSSFELSATEETRIKIFDGERLVLNHKIK